MITSDIGAMTCLRTGGRALEFEIGEAKSVGDSLQKEMETCKAVTYV